MSTRPQLEGPIYAVPVDEADKLRRENIQLQQVLRDSREEMERMAQGFDLLMKRLRPMHQLLKALFEENIDPVPGKPSTAPTPPNRSAWDAWKQQLPDRCGRIIEALLVQPLTQTQMKTFCKMDQATVSRAVAVLDRNGLVERDGRRIRLKRL